MPIFTSHMDYEGKLTLGFVRFVLSPLKNYRALISSYFAADMLKGFLLGLGLMLVLEPALIHFLIAATLVDEWQWFAQVLMILFEAAVLRFILGHLYALQFAKVSVTPESLCVRFGLIRNFTVALSNIESIELGNRRTVDDKTAKITLLNSPNIRIFFKEPAFTGRMTRAVYLKSIDLYLREAELAGLVGLVPSGVRS